MPIIWSRHTIEHMREDIQIRLRRLGVVKGSRHLKPVSKPPDSSVPSSPIKPATESEKVALTAFTNEDDPQPLEMLLPGGRVEETSNGACFVLDKVYPLSYQHGADRLEDLCCLTPYTAATFCRDDRLAGLNFRDFLFLDTETTGLAGAGTLAFMVGAAFFEADAFVVRQYFLRDQGDEPAMLLLLAELLDQKGGLITFNGRSFDLPLLDNRYLMNRIDLPGEGLLDMPHIDLLLPSRRLWRNRLGSCALGALEQKLLGLRRSHADVPGWAIPGLYYDYLRHGDGRDMARVFYHNEMDMVSMATLASRIVRQFEQPDGSDYPQDLVSLGKWQSDLGLLEEAEKNLRLAATLDLPLDLYHQALYQLATLLKRQDRREEAILFWRQIAVTSFDDVVAHVELAKYYEWHGRDLSEATTWTRRALALVDSWASSGSPPAYAGRLDLLRSELAHRLARLESKRG